MSGNLRSAWDVLVHDVWERLESFSSSEQSPPVDLFSDLFEVVDEFLSPRPSDRELEEALNDPQVARKRFMLLKGVDFASESSLVLFIEEAYRLIGDYEIEGFAGFYKERVREAVVKLNLRYRIDDPFILRFLLPGSFSNLYSELHRLNGNNALLTELLWDFEKAFDRYARTLDPTDLRTCIGNASKYAEGLAGFSCGRAAPLSELCRELKDWPHGAVQAALTNLYGFCSDYPGIRHAGNPAGVRRALATRDVTVASILILSFSGYLSPLLDERTILGV